MIFELVAFGLFAYLVLKFYWLHVTRPWSHISNIPLQIYPILGHIPSVIGFTANEFHHLFLDWLDRSPITALWIGLRPNVLCKDVKLFESIMSSNKVLTKSSNYWVFDDWLGLNLFTSTGAFWRRRRKLLTPSFHFNILTEFLPTMVKHSQDLVKALKKQPDSFNAFKVMKTYSLGVILETSMGVENDFIDIALDVANNETVKDSPGEHQANIFRFLKAIDRLLVILVNRNDRPWQWYKTTFQLTPVGQDFYETLDFVKKFGTNIIEKRIEQLKEKPMSDEKQIILLDRLLKSLQNGEVNVEDVLNETQGFMFAGYDTVATALSWCLFMIGSHPEIQQKAFEEVKNVEKLNLPLNEMVKELKYVECVIKETLRIHPSAPIVSREIEEEMVFDSWKFPKGTTFSICILAMQRDPNNWSDPMVFKPERFGSPEHDWNPFAFIPFSAGPRNCIGQRFAMMEMKCTLYHLLLNFEIVAKQRAEDLLETIGVIHGVMNEEGLQIEMKPRNL
eukprot:TCONS_00020144-protein